MKFRALREERVTTKLASSQITVCAVVKQIDREHKASDYGLVKQVQVLGGVCPCVHIGACVYAIARSITITPTVRGGWVWLTSSSQRGSISEKEDQ